MIRMNIKNDEWIDEWLVLFYHLSFSISISVCFLCGLLPGLRVLWKNNILSMCNNKFICWAHPLAESIAR